MGAGVGVGVGVGVPGGGGSWGIFDYVLLLLQPPETSSVAGSLDRDKVFMQYDSGNG